MLHNLLNFEISPAPKLCNFSLQSIRFSIFLLHQNLKRKKAAFLRYTFVELCIIKCSIEIMNEQFINMICIVVYVVQKRKKCSSHNIENCFLAFPLLHYFIFLFCNFIRNEQLNSTAGNYFSIKKLLQLAREFFQIAK